MSLNKPRPDYPIYPSTGYFRERAKAFKRPKGRRGRKPKGQRVGNFVPYQDPNFLIIKAQDEARKARELALAEAQQAAADREESKLIARQQLQLAQGSAQLQAAEAQARVRQKDEELDIRREEQRQNTITQREQLRLQGEAQQETQRYRGAKLAQIANQGQARGQAEREIVGQLRKLTEDTERRQGENREIFQQFLASQDRRGDLSVSNIQEQERTDLPKQQSADDRRDRRGRSISIDESVSSNLTDLDLPDEEGFGAGHRTRGDKQRKKPKRFEGGATEAELAQAGGIVGQTPRELKTEPKSEPQPEPQQTEQRPKLKAGEVKAGKQGGRAPLAKKAETKPTDTSVFGSSPAGQAFAAEVKKSEEALRKAKERGGN